MIDSLVPRNSIFHFNGHFSKLVVLVDIFLDLICPALCWCQLIRGSASTRVYTVNVCIKEEKYGKAHIKLHISEILVGILMSHYLNTWWSVKQDNLIPTDEL